MKKFYVLMCLAALIGSFTACEKSEQGGGDKPSGEKEKLAAPVVTFEQKSLSSVELKWEAVANAVSYTFQPEGQDMIVAEGTSLVVENLKVGKTKITCKSNADAESNYTDSNWSEFEVTIAGGYTPQYQDYLGTWEITPSRKAFYDFYKQDAEPAFYEDNEDPLVVYIQETEDLDFNAGPVKAYYVTGLSQIVFGTDDDPIYVPYIGTYNFLANEEDEAGETTELHRLEIFCGFGFAAENFHPDLAGYVAAPAGLCTVNGDESELAPVGGQYPGLQIQMTDENGAAQMIGFKGDLQDGGSFECIGLELFLLDPNTGSIKSGWNLYDQENPNEGLGYYVGPFTVKRLSTEVGAPAFRNDRRMNTAKVIDNVISTFKAKTSVLVK